MQLYAKVLENTQEGDIGTCACTQGSRGPQEEAATRGGLTMFWPGGSRGFTRGSSLQGVRKGWAALEKQPAEKGHSRLGGTE